MDIKKQIVFLDINMEGQDGLKTAIKIKELSPEIYIVLVTAYMSYSLEGYKVKASRFLVNMRYIEKISSYVLRLITGKEISVSKSRYQEVKRRYALYKGAE